jgi:hypothetical protein
VRYQVVSAYDEVVPDGLWDFVEERYAHVRIFVEGRDVGIVAGFGEEGQGETAPFVWRLREMDCQHNVVFAACRLAWWFGCIR